MSKNVFIDPDGVDAANNRIRAVHTRMSEMCKRLNAVLTENHGCWGDDEIGKKFEEGYVGAEDTLTESNEMIAKNIGETAAAIDRNMTDLLAQDAENGNNIRK
ncbi:hypothetical protein [Saccharopolyspora sp. NPDC002686]|uniref:WXG100 family type VII secretion target n=1 Tax=Saccharopolyspora sp. NPDC002686 TaxID=3154541 RepID=UPI0033266D9A